MSSEYESKANVGFLAILFLIAVCGAAYCICDLKDNERALEKRISVLEKKR